MKDGNLRVRQLEAWAKATRPANRSSKLSMSTSTLAPKPSSEPSTHWRGAPSSSAIKAMRTPPGHGVLLMGSGVVSITPALTTTFPAFAPQRMRERTKIGGSFRCH